MQPAFFNNNNSINRMSKKKKKTTLLTLCATFIFRWIIGAAVVNAFYSPNRNQIGRFTTLLNSCMETINHFLHYKGASLLSRGKPACALVKILGKVDRLFFSSSCFVDDYSAFPTLPPPPNLAGIAYIL